MASFSYFPEVHNLLFLESSYLVGCSLGSGIDKILPRCALRGYRRQWETYTFLYKGDIEAASLPSFFLSRHLSFPALLPLSGSVRADQHICWPEWTPVGWTASPPLYCDLQSPIFTEILKERWKPEPPPQANYLELILLPPEVKVEAGNCPIFVFPPLKKPWRHDLVSVLGNYLCKSVSCLFGPGLDQITSSAGIENGPFSTVNFKIVQGTQ